MAQIENNLYMFLADFRHCSKDRWHFCNFLHKMTGGIIVIKHSFFPSFSDTLNGHEEQLLKEEAPPSSKILLKFTVVVQI